MDNIENPNRISVCLAVKNEERVIERCLRSLYEVVDEIIVVDDFSEDKTIEICRKYTHKIFQRKSPGYCEPNRIFGIKQADGNWILILDADEFLSEELRQNLRTLVNHPSYDGYKIRIVNFYGDIPIKAGVYRQFALRLYRKDKVKLMGNIHEHPKIDGKVGKVAMSILHKPLYNNFTLSTFKKKQLQRSWLHAEHAEHRNPRIYYLFKAFFMFTATFILNFFLRRGFLDGTVGLKANLVYSAYYFMVNYYLFKRR